MKREMDGLGSLLEALAFFLVVNGVLVGIGCLVFW